MSQKQRMLIVGGTGYVGSSLARHFKDEYEVICTVNRSFTPIPGVRYLPLRDFADSDQCKAVGVQAEPNVVIFCAGSNHFKKAEDDQRTAQIVHTGGATNTLAGTEIFKPKYIFLSSDYAFAGTEGNYAEDDSTLPILNIGKAKLAAENYVRSRSLNHLIIRSAPLIGRGTVDHPSLFDEIRLADLYGKTHKLSGKSIRNPVHISFLIQIIQRALELDLKNKILHCGGLTKVSDQEMGNFFAEKIGLPTDTIETLESDANQNTTFDFSVNFSETLKLLKLEPLFLEQSLDLL